MTALESAWYEARGWTAVFLPLTWLYGLAVWLKRAAYRVGLIKSYAVAAPVIVVGNITVGGTGKTPLTIALTRRLQAQGLRVGIISRGYGGKAPSYPWHVTDETSVGWCGDEPALLFQLLKVPVVVDPNRVRAAQTLCDQHNVDVILSDDGLQHLRLARAAEIIVVDGRRGFGNRWLLPAGPLRESLTRLDQVDLVLIRDGKTDEPGFKLSLGHAQDLRTRVNRSLREFSADPVTAIAGIGHPEGFFQQLRDAGLTVDGRAFPDHHPYTAQELNQLPAGVVLMTEKDAIKCQAFAQTLPAGRFWAVSADAQLNARGQEAVAQVIDQIRVLVKDRSEK